MSAAKGNAAAAVKRRPTFAAARLQACATVFARSRIHFDARRAPAPGAAATDRLPDHSFAPADADQGIVVPLRAPQPAETPVH